MSKRFHHLGIVVKDLDEVAKLYSEILDLTPGNKGVIEDLINGVRALALHTGHTVIELIQPTSSENRFAKFLKEKGEGLFNICYFTEDFDKEVEVWKEKGYIVEEQMALSNPAHPFRQAWLSPESSRGVWIELVDAAAKHE